MNSACMEQGAILSPDPERFITLVERAAEQVGNERLTSAP